VSRHDHVSGIGCSRAKTFERHRQAVRAKLPAGTDSRGKTSGGAGRAEPMEDTDVVHYDLDIEISDLNAGTGQCMISGTNRMTVTSKSAALTEFTFRLRSQYTITSALINDTTPVGVATASTTTRVATLDRSYGMDETSFATLYFLSTTSRFALAWSMASS